MKKLDQDVEKLSVTIKAGTVDGEKVALALEALIERLNQLYAEVKNQKVTSGAFVQ